MKLLLCPRLLLSLQQWPFDSTCGKELASTRVVVECVSPYLVHLTELACSVLGKWLVGVLFQNGANTVIAILLPQPRSSKVTDMDNLNSQIYNEASFL